MTPTYTYNPSSSISYLCLLVFNFFFVVDASSYQRRQYDYNRFSWIVTVCHPPPLSLNPRIPLGWLTLMITIRMMIRVEMN